MISVQTNANLIAADLGKVAGRVVGRARLAVDLSGRQVAEAWRSNAEQTSGEHGKHYPKSIQSRMTGALEATVAPQEGMQQAGMSFEYGSRNQPPHLDGQRAVDRLAPVIEAQLATILDVL